MLFHRKLCLIQIFFSSTWATSIFHSKWVLPFPVKIYPFEIFTRAKPGISLVIYIVRCLQIEFMAQHILNYWTGRRTILRTPSETWNECPLKEIGWRKKYCIIMDPLTTYCCLKLTCSSEKALPKRDFSPILFASKQWSSCYILSW